MHVHGLTKAGRGRTGFTLIELLVVVAIIAVLAAVLFPVFAQAKTAAMKATDLTNARSQAQSFLLYASDHDDTTVPLFTSTSDFYMNYDWETDRFWPQLVMPYQKSWQIHRNPIDAMANDRQSLLNMDVPEDAPQGQKEWAIGQNTSYGLNYMAWSPYSGDLKPRGVSFSSGSDPSRSIILACSIWAKDGARPYGGGNWFIEAPTSDFTESEAWNGGWQINDATSWLQYGASWPWFNGQMNAAFADGSVRTASVSTLLSGVTRDEDGSITGVYDKDLYLWDR